MAKKTDRNIIVGLDIGTSKVAAIVAEHTGNDEIEIIGIGVAPSKGLKKGVVVNLESTVHSIQRAIEEAELMAGCQIQSVFAGIAGSHIKSLNSHGIVAIKEKEVTQYDIDRVIDSARAVAIPADQKILHILPQEFVIDQQDGIKEPIGMSGIRLEAKVHMVTCSVSAAQNIIKCIRRCGLEVEDIVLEQLASCTSVLTEDEKELGVCLIDIGGGTTDIAIYERGSLWYTSVIPIGGDNFTNDLAIGLRTPISEAEKIKKKYGCALSSITEDEEETIEVPSVGGRKPRILPKKIIVDIIQPRAEEIFRLINDEIKKMGYEKSLNSGIVLAGGGALLDGLEEIAEEVFDLPARRGIPTGVLGLVDRINSPDYATSVGLLLYGYNQRIASGIKKKGKKGIFKNIMEWFKENF